MTRKQRERQERIALGLIAVVVIVLMGMTTYMNWSQYICREVPNHYSCK
jgi:hypothetical protein